MSQSINLGNIKTVLFNGTEMAETKLNANSIWVGQTELTISSNTNNYDIGAAVLAAGGDKATNVQLTINPGVTVGSTSSTNSAMKTGTGWSNGTTITIINNGSIVGASGNNSTGTTGNGGNGGTGGALISWYEDGMHYGHRPGTSGSGGSAGSLGTPPNGGAAFEHTQTLDNYLSVVFNVTGSLIGGSSGTVTAYGGGGGGGGGGSSANYTQPGGGGGGGGGYGSGGSGGYYGYGNGANGRSGGATNGGSGGRNGANRCNGGNGGNAGTGSNGAGGSAGPGDYWGSSPGYGGSGGNIVSSSGSSGSVLSGNTGQIS